MMLSTKLTALINGCSKQLGQLQTAYLDTNVASHQCIKKCYVFLMIK